MRPWHWKQISKPQDWTKLKRIAFLNLALAVPYFSPNRADFFSDNNTSLNYILVLLSELVPVERFELPKSIKTWVLQTRAIAAMRHRLFVQTEWCSDFPKLPSSADALDDSYRESLNHHNTVLSELQESNPCLLSENLPNYIYLLMSSNHRRVATPNRSLRTLGLLFYYIRLSPLSQGFRTDEFREEGQLLR